MQLTKNFMVLLGLAFAFSLTFGIVLLADLEEEWIYVVSAWNIAAWVIGVEVFL